MVVLENPPCLGGCSGGGPDKQGQRGSYQGKGPAWMGPQIACQCLPFYIVGHGTATGGFQSASAGPKTFVPGRVIGIRLLLNQTCYSSNRGGEFFVIEICVGGNDGLFH